MDKKESLAIARKVRAQRRSEKKDREAYVKELRDRAVEAFGADPADVEVQLYGEGLVNYVIYIWDREAGVALAHRLPD